MQQRSIVFGGGEGEGGGSEAIVCESCQAFHVCGAQEVDVQVVCSTVRFVRVHITASVVFVGQIVCVCACALGKDQIKYARAMKLRSGRRW